MTNLSKPLTGKNALICGGSRGIGAAIAKRLAGEGAAVALTYSTSAESAAGVVRDIEAAGGAAFALEADSGDVAALHEATEETAQRLGGIDILVNNAGMLALNLLDDVSVAEFDRMINVNVRGMFFATQAAVRHMAAGGRIVNIGSNTAVRSAFPGSSVYTLSKTAIAGMTRALAHDLGPRGITINNVQPGPTVTDMNPADGPHAAQLRTMNAVKRMGEAEEVASLVAYLAGAESAYMTGASLTVDGGMST